MQLVCVHGAGGSGLSYYYLTEHFANCDAVNLPGHPQGKMCTSIEEYTQWLRGYIWGKGYEDVVLMGHSMGGGIVQTYALNHPEELKGIILSGTGARLRVHPDYLREELEASQDPAKYQVWLKNREVGLAKVDPEMRKRLLQSSAEVGPAVQHNDMSACDRFDIMDRVHEISVPTLIIVGSEDIMTPAKYAHYLHEKIAGSHEVVFEGATHSLNTEQPEKVIPVIEEFLGTLS
jgi:pimeloyl-ACP methyl ester carboxylesterase